MSQEDIKADLMKIQPVKQRLNKVLLVKALCYFNILHPFSFLPVLQQLKAGLGHFAQQKTGNLVELKKAIIPYRLYPIFRAVRWIVHPESHSDDCRGTSRRRRIGRRGRRKMPKEPLAFTLTLLVQVIFFLTLLTSPLIVIFFL